MKVQGINATTIAIWAVLLIGLFFVFGFGPIFFGAMLVVALVWRVVEKKRKGGSMMSSTPPPFNPGA